MSTPGGPNALDGKLRFLLEASASLAGSSAHGELVDGVLQLACKLNSADACAIWKHDLADGSWRILSSVGLSAEYAAAIITGAARTVVEQPYCVEDLSDAPEAAERRQAYESEGLRALLAIPMRAAGRVSGTLAFYYRRPHGFPEAELRTATALSCLAASALETAELIREQERAHVRSAFLAEASAALSSSLDYEATLAALARLAVPQIADWCVIDMGRSDGSLERLAVAHADPGRDAWVDEMRRKYPINRGDQHGPAAVFRTGQSSLHSVVTDETLIRASRGPEHLSILRGLGLTSYMCVPLAVRDRVLGVITFASSTEGRHFGPDDLAFAEDLARRAAMAIENAMLYTTAQRERAALEAALAALRDNEERLLLAMDAGRLGIWDWKLATSTLDATDNAAALLGFAPGLFPTNMVAMIEAIHPDDRNGFIACTDRAIQQRSYFECEFRAQTGDGELRWLAAKGKVLTDDSGKPARIIGIVMDITERRLLEEKLRSSQKLESIGQLAGGIAHDFNNLLTGILGNASLALELLPPKDATLPLLNAVVEASERAADLTRQLLAYSGKARIVVSPLDLSELIGDITHLLQTTVPKLIDLKLDLAAGLPPVEADSSQIQQVVMNLVINAAEAIGERWGTVLVRTSLRRLSDPLPGGSGFSNDLPPGVYLCLEVRDNGCGIEAGAVSRIFDPFYTTKFTGRGLGLAAVAGIVRTHRGAIRVASTVGQGSAFEVFFPPASTTVHEDGDRWRTSGAPS